MMFRPGIANTVSLGLNYIQILFYLALCQVSVDYGYER